MRPIKFNLPKVVIIGRPKVGKSSLFNCIIKKRKSVIEKYGNTTRDRVSSFVNWDDRDFELIDTPGLDSTLSDFAGRKDSLKQIDLAIKEANEILFICDGKVCPLPLDYKICSLIRKSGKPSILVVNKIDAKHSSEKLIEYYNLGMGDPLAVSALHRLGIADLLDTLTLKLKNCSVAAKLALPQGKTDTEQSTKIAIVGRPNVGKSSLVNKILGEERIVVSDIPGTTRDAIDTYFEKDGEKFIITDTAGMRSKRKIKDGATYFSILRTEGTIKRSDVAIILLDAPIGVTKEDHRIIDIVQKNFKPFVLAVNKWDLSKKEKIHKNEYEAVIRNNVRFIYNAPIVFISSLTGENTELLFKIAAALVEKSKKNFSSSELNKFLRVIPFSQTRIYSVRQVNSLVPEFEIIAKNPELVNESGRNYIINKLRQELGLEGIPIIVRFRKKVFK